MTKNSSKKLLGLLAPGLHSTARWSVASALLQSFLLFASPDSVQSAVSVPIRLKIGDHLALAGDSITEQKLYTRFIEDYLLMCAPQMQTEVCQLGWSGEMAQGFFSRMDKSFDGFRPDLVTVFYGMNDSSRGVYVPPMKKIAAKFKAEGIPAIIVSPGTMDSYYGIRGNDRQFWASFNREQGLMGTEANKIATENGLGFIDLHTPLLEVMAKAKERYRPNYDVCGADGVHPRANGHLIIAWAILKGLGLSGDIGTITVAMKGGSSATEGHKILSDDNGKVFIESSRYPFCFLDAPKQLSPDQVNVAGSTAGILPCFSFNEDLNRFRLVVVGLGQDKAKVTWGTSSRVFSKQDLEKGINLAATFIDNPFTNAFAQVDAAVLKQQRFESVLMKNVIGGVPLPKPASGSTPAPELSPMTKEQAIARRAELVQAARVAVKPVRHQITITPIETK